ncbi:MAG: phenylacetate--CoA ligase family protein [Mycobacterium sp.]
MNDRLLQLYHRLPPAGRGAVASARGLYLRQWRYGRETPSLVEAALERDTWSAARWTTWREERLAFVLDRAATRVPYYREMWSARRRRGDHASWEQLENWPLLGKDALRASPHAFLADDVDARRMFHEHTSGTTGQPLNLWWSRATVRQWYALSEARCRRWHGVSRLDRWGILGGQLIAPVSQRTPPFWVWNAALRQLYLSSYHLAPDLLPHYLEAIRSHRVTYLWGYPSALFELACAAAESPQPLRLRTVITNAEPLLPHQAAAIERGGGCAPRETYGMAEIVANASACPDGRLHWWPEVGWVEQVADGQTDGSRELVCTGLLNADMPLIRYRVGDRIIAGQESRCSCGRSLPLAGTIVGRSDDVLYTRDGRRLGRLDPVFKGGLPIREAQIIQDDIDNIRVRYVPSADARPGDEERITAQIRQRIGDVHVILEPVPMIPRTAAGKFRAVICNLPQPGTGAHPAVAGRAGTTVP